MYFSTKEIIGEDVIDVEAAPAVDGEKDFVVEFAHCQRSQVLHETHFDQ